MLPLFTLASETINAAIYQIKVDSFSYAEILPAMSLIKDTWKGKFHRGEQAFSQNRIQFSYNKDNFVVSLNQRFDYLTIFTSDFAQFIYQDKNKIEHTDNKEIQAKLSVKHLEAFGASIGYKFSPTKNLTITPHFNYWKTTDLTHGKVAGDIFYKQNSLLQGDLLVDYYYERDVLFGRPEESVSDYGTSIDLNIDWQITDNLATTLELKDLFNEFSWDRVPHTQATVSNLEGRSTRTPIVQGKENYRSIKQKLPINGEVSVNFQQQAWEYGIGAKYYNNDIFPNITLSKLYGADNITLGYQFKQQALMLNWNNSWLDIGISLDKIQLDKAQNIAVNFSYIFQS